MNLKDLCDYFSDNLDSNIIDTNELNQQISLQKILNDHLSDQKIRFLAISSSYDLQITEFLRDFESWLEKNFNLNQRVFYSFLLSRVLKRTELPLLQDEANRGEITADCYDDFFEKNAFILIDKNVTNAIDIREFMDRVIQTSKKIAVLIDKVKFHILNKKDKKIKLVESTVGEKLLGYREQVLHRIKLNSRYDDYGFLANDPIKSELLYLLPKLGFSDNLYIAMPLATDLVNSWVTSRAKDEKIDSNFSASDYEAHCAEILNRNGWLAFRTSTGPDQGVDIIATKGKVKLIIQCKYYSSGVGNKAVQEAISGKSFELGTHAAVVTNSYFTPAARSLAQQTNVLLLNEKELSSLSSRLP